MRLLHRPRFYFEILVWILKVHRVRRGNFRGPVAQRRDALRRRWLPGVGGCCLMASYRGHRLKSAILLLVSNLYFDLYAQNFARSWTGLMVLTLDDYHLRLCLASCL